MKRLFIILYVLFLFGCSNKVISMEDLKRDIKDNDVTKFSKHIVQIDKLNEDEYKELASTCVFDYKDNRFIEILLNNGMSVDIHINEKSEPGYLEGMTLLYAVLKNNNEDLLQTLLDKNPNVYKGINLNPGVEDCIECAIAFSSFSSFKIFFDYIDINVISEKRAYDYLTKLKEYPDRQKLDYIIAKGIPKIIPDPMVPCFIIENENNKLLDEFVKKIKNECKLRFQDEIPYFQKALDCCNFEIVKWLLDNEVDPHIENNETAEGDMLNAFDYARYMARYFRYSLEPGQEEENDLAMSEKYEDCAKLISHYVKNEKKLQD